MQLIRLLSIVALAWYLVPADFGLIAMAFLVTGFLELFVDLGTGQALIQRRDLDDNLISSVFWANLGLGCLAAVLVSLVAPWLGWVFRAAELEALILWLAPVFVISSLGVVHSSLLQRQMRFAAFAKVRLLAAILQAGVAVSMAVSGCGVWSLVGGYWVGAVTATIGYGLSSAWRPRLACKLCDLRTVAGFSLNLSGVNLVNFVFAQADTLIIGRWLGAETLGCYSLAKKIVVQPTLAVGLAVSNVLFSRFSRLQDDFAAIRSLYLRAATALAAGIFPAMLGAAVLAEPIVAALAGSRWAPVAPLIVALAPAAMLAAIILPTGALFRATGRAGLLLRWGSVRGVVLCIGYVVGSYWGALGVALGFSTAMLVVMWPSVALAGAVVDLRPSRVLAELGPILLGSLFMASAVFALAGVLRAGGVSAPASSIVGVVTGVVLYVAALVWLRPPVVDELDTKLRGRRAVPVVVPQKGVS